MSRNNTIKVTLGAILARFPKLYRILLKCLRPDAFERRVYLSLIKPGHVVVDGGANRGFLTTLFCELVGSAGAVHAFEPFPPTFAKLTAAAGRYKPPRLFLNACGLGEKPDTLEFTMPGTDDGQTSLRPHSKGSWKDSDFTTSLRCPITTLDDYAKTSGLTRLDFVKLDVEGAELLALRGGAETFKRFQPLVLFELSPAWLIDFGFSPGEFFAELEALGYSGFWLLNEPITEFEQGAWKEFVSMGGIDSVNFLSVPSAYSRAELRARLKGC